MYLLIKVSNAEGDGVVCKYRIFEFAVMPVAVAIMTPILPMLLMLIQRISGKSASFQPRNERLVAESSAHTSNASFVGGGDFVTTSICPS